MKFVSIRMNRVIPGHFRSASQLVQAVWAKIPEIYRAQLGLAPLVDPSTGKQVDLASHARIQERSLALDDAQAMRTLHKKEKELEAILDSEDATEPEKAEALRDLEQIAEFQKHHARRTKDGSQRAVAAVRKAIIRFHQRLLTGSAPAGAAHQAFQAVATHIEKYLLTPSAGYRGPSGTRARGPFAGCFTYQPPQAVHWLP